MRSQGFSLIATLVLTILVAAASAQTVTQLGQFTAPDLYYQSYFGYSAAIAGDTVVVSAPSNDLDGSELYVYEKPAGGWSTVTPTAEFGFACSDGGRLAISADGSTIASLTAQCYGGLGFGSTAIAVWVRPAGGWQNNAPPTAIIVDNHTEGSQCGNNFAMSSDGKTIVCSDGFASGKHYLFFFDRPSTGWASTTKPNQTVALNHAVFQIAMNGNIIAVDEQNVPMLQIFQRTAGGLQQLAHLTTSDGVPFGVGMTIDSDTIAIQGYVGNDSVGKVYLYSKPASGWTNATETAQITAASSTSLGIQFGYSIAKSGNALLVGAAPDAYVYFQPASGWKTTDQPNVTLVSSDPYAVDFGGGVAIQGTTIVIGDPQEGADYNQNGAAYVFDAK